MLAALALGGAAQAQEPVPSTPAAVRAWAAKAGLDLKGWELESTDQDSAAFYAQQAPVGPTMNLTLRLEYFRPSPLPDGQKVRSVSAVIELDCKLGRRRYHNTMLYAGNDFRAFIRRDPDTDWEALDPKNPHDDYLAWRCAGRPPIKSTAHHRRRRSVHAYKAANAAAKR
jgi:hypothetical protein